MILFLLLAAPLRLIVTNYNDFLQSLVFSIVGTRQVTVYSSPLSLFSEQTKSFFLGKGFLFFLLFDLGAD